MKEDKEIKSLELSESEQIEKEAIRIVKLEVACTRLREIEDAKRRQRNYHPIF